LECSAFNIKKGRIAKRRDVTGRIIKRNAREGGVEAPEIDYRSRL